MIPSAESARCSWGSWPAPIRRPQPGVQQDREDSSAESAESADDLICGISGLSWDRGRRPPASAARRPARSRTTHLRTLRSYPDDPLCRISRCSSGDAWPAPIRRPQPGVQQDREDYLRNLRNLRMIPHLRNQRNPPGSWSAPTRVSSPASSKIKTDHLRHLSSLRMIPSAESADVLGDRGPRPSAVRGRASSKIEKTICGICGICG